jgi:hypothetical protein
LDHEVIIAARLVGGNGFQRALAGGRLWVSDPSVSEPPLDDGVPMYRNPFINFNRHAEALGYPALLLVSLFCLTLVVGAVGSLAVWASAWTFALAVLSIPVACVILAAATIASLNETDDR